MQVKRTGIVLKPDCRRVILKAFGVSDSGRITRILERILALADTEADELYQNVLDEFKDRHTGIETFFRRRFDEMRRFLPPEKACSERRSLLIGAFFSHEYSIEAAALFNPAIIWHPDQSGLPPGSKRFILSLRATGEGHISSLTFRTGTVDKENHIVIDDPGGYAGTAQRMPEPLYDRALFENRAERSGVLTGRTRAIIARLSDPFRRSDLETCVKETAGPLSGNDPAADPLLALCHYDYQLKFSQGNDISARVIYPVTASEANGIEDARFVAFTGGADVTYYATYTAYDGHHIRVKLLETEDFLVFRSAFLTGPAIENKGIALFPQKINGKYAMLSRQDNEHNFIMFSDDLYYWDEKIIVQSPVFPWEFIQLGNCGSPLETEYGWLVFSHGVGAMRKYCIGAFLLDRNDPARLIARTPAPLLTPDGMEREGYVPNVVYSCGAIIHGSDVILPYAMSDTATGFALINLKDLIGSMKTVSG